MRMVQILKTFKNFQLNWSSCNFCKTVVYLCQSSSLFSTKNSSLTSIDLEIIRRHKQAERLGKKFYEDPVTKYFVITYTQHLERGECCGSACRHCPYNQVNVKNPSLKKEYNGFFFK